MPGKQTSLGQRAREAEVGEHAGVREAGDGGDAVVAEGEDHQAVGVRERGVGVAQVAAEGRLAVGAGGDEPEPVELPAARDGGQEAGDRGRALVFERRRAASSAARRR